MSLTATHHDLDLDALERISSGAHSVGRAVVDACDAITGAVVLATCNRFEVYLDVAVPGDAVLTGLESPPNAALLDHATAGICDIVARTVADGALPAEQVRAALRMTVGQDVAGHLFEVACGLDSMVVGEREISGQVRRALHAARGHRTTTPLLEQAFQFASRVSRRVESATGLGGAGRSVVGVGLDLAAASAPPWRQARTILIGTGSYAGASLAALRGRGCDDVRVYSRSGRADAFATARGVAAVPDGDLVEALADADVVVSCSGGIGAVLDAAAVVSARARAVEHTEEHVHVTTPRPLVVLDLALGHDVDPRVGDIDGVMLIDLATIRAHAPAAGSEPVRRARGVVEDGLAEFAERLAERAADREVVELCRASGAAVTAELERVRDSGLQGRELAEVERSVRRRAAAELHGRIMRVKEAARGRVARRGTASASAVVPGPRGGRGWHGRAQAV